MRDAGRPGFLDQETYELVRASVPIASVDLLPWRTDGDSRQVLLIRRRDRRGRPCWCWIGGRVHIDETLADAIERHLLETIGADLVIGRFDPSRPDAVIEYARIPRDDGPYDEAQHSLGMTYLIPTNGGSVQPAGEAMDAEWFAIDALPPADEFSFGQSNCIRDLASQLAR